MLLLIGTLTAQTVQKPKNGNKVELQGILYIHPNIYEGSIYLHREWLSGNITLENGTTAYDIKLKYNILSGDLIFYHETLSKLYVTDRNILHSFTLNQGKPDSLYFIKYNGEGMGFRLKKSDYVELLHNGNLKFMIKHTANISAANELNTKDKVFPRKYYFIEKEGQLHEIKPRVRSVIKLFPDRRSEIKHIAAEHHLHNKSVTDIAKLIKLMDQE